MGKCYSAIRNLKGDDTKNLIQEKQPFQEQIHGKTHQEMMRKIDLINNWQSYELQTIVERIMTMCEYQKKNHMNFTLFLQFFPALKPMSMKTQIRYFDLFDFTRSSYINIRQIIFGVSQIYFTPKSQYSQLLKEIYKRSKGDCLTASEFKLFIHQNKSLLDKAIQSQKCVLQKQSIKELDFDLLVAKYFNIQQYQRYFDFYDTELQISILESIRSSDGFEKNADLLSQDRRSDKRRSKIFHDQKKFQQRKGESYEIKIKNNDRVFLVTKDWFESWVKYMAIHECYQINYQIQTQNNSIFERKNFSFDEVFMENAKLTRPSKIYNYDLLSQYETDLKPNLVKFQDFILLPEKMWKKLITIYKGGPQIERVYPHLFDTIVVNKVYIDGKGKFIEGKTVRCIMQPNQKLEQLFKNQIKQGHLYFHRVPVVLDQQKLNFKQVQLFYKWQQFDKNTLIDKSLHHSFAVFVLKSLKTLFESNYRCFGPSPITNVAVANALRKQNRFSYGQMFTFKTHTYYNKQDESKDKIQHLQLNAYVVDIRRNQAKLHFVNHSDTSDDYYDIQQLSKGIDSQQKHIVSNRNNITTFQGLENCSYINSVLQVLIASPFFSDYFLKQKHIRSLSSDVALQSCLSTAFSKVIYDVKRHQKNSVRADDLYKKINSKVQEINFQQVRKEYPQKFITKFLQTLSCQLGNPEKLFDKYPLVTNFEQNKNQYKNQKFKGSIIEAFFKLSQSTKSICSTCKSQSISTEYSFILQVPLPEDQQVCYPVIFCPINSSSFTTYGITIRKSQKFVKYAQKFSELINIQLSRLSFAQVENSQFRKHYTQFDYQSSLFNIDLNPKDIIYVFQLRNYRVGKELDQIDQTFSDKFLSLKVGDIVDFNLYKEWHVGRIIDTTKQKLTIQNFDGKSEVEKKRIDNFKNKTQQKSWYQIDLLHRRMNKKTDRVQFFLVPSVITIAEWMSWASVFGIIKNYLKNYFSTQDNDSLDDLFANFSQFLECKSGNKHDSIESDEQKCIFNQSQIGDNPSSDRSRYPQIKSESHKSRKSQIYTIKIILKNSGQICAICNKKCIFKKENQHFDAKYCYGCSFSIDQQEPIGIKINPNKISIVLDWIPIHTDQLISRIEYKKYKHPTYLVVEKEIKKQINTIDDCFQLYIQTNRKVEIDCNKCGKGLGEQTRYLSQCPNILIIHLNRFKTYKNQEHKLNNKIEVKRELTIQKIQMESKKQDTYQLYGIICHRQINGLEKWYSCVLKTRNVWVKCQDTFANLIDFDKIQKDEIYLLLYRKKNIKCTILSMIF